MIGQSDTGGPLLSALLEFNFTDVFLLCPIDKYNVENSPETHARFLQWYSESLTETGKTVNISAVTADLLGLDDLVGIKSAERLAFQLGSKKVGESGSITIYISPGTSLMAFGWAEIIQENPNANVRLLMSPRAGSKPIFIPH